MIMISRPLTISGLSELASIRASNTLAGRRLAKRSISLRRRRSPRSGFLLNSTLSHLGPPTEPNSTASASSAVFMASSESGTPCLSSAAPPTTSSLMSKPTARLLPIQAMILRTSFITSGPMPSPGSTSRLRLDAIVFFLLELKSRASGRCMQPGLGVLLAGLEVVDLRLLLHGQADIVEAIQQAMLAEGVDREMHGAAVGSLDLLLLEVDLDDGIGAAARIVHQLGDDLLWHPDRQDAVLEAVVVEDVGEILGDDAADAEIEQRPRGMLAARAAAEIGPGDDDLGVLVGRLVEDEILLLAVRRPAHFVEEAFLQAGALDGLQEVLGDDHVGVDIDHRQRCGDAAQRREFFHGIALVNAGIDGLWPASSSLSPGEHRSRHFVVQTLLAGGKGDGQAGDKGDQSHQRTEPGAAQRGYGRQIDGPCANGGGTEAQTRAAFGGNPDAEHSLAEGRLHRRAFLKREVGPHQQCVDDHLAGRCQALEVLDERFD